MKRAHFLAEVAATICIAAVVIVGCNTIASPSFDPLHFLGVFAVCVTALNVVRKIVDRLDR